MMKWIFILLLTAAPLGAFEVHGEFQAGHDIESQLSYTYIRLELVEAPIMLYGGWRTWFEFDLASGYPFRDIYEVGARFSWRNLFLDINSFCNHPVLYQEAGWRSNIWGENITTVSVGIRW